MSKHSSEELMKKEEVLRKMEKEIKDRCAALDEREAQIKLLEEHVCDVSSSPISKYPDLLTEMSAHVSDIYTAWKTHMGNTDGRLIKTIENLLNIRNSLEG